MNECLEVSIFQLQKLNFVRDKLNFILADKNFSQRNYFAIKETTIIKTKTKQNRKSLIYAIGSFPFAFFKKR